MIFEKYFDSTEFYYNLTDFKYFKITLIANGRSRRA